MNRNLDFEQGPIRPPNESKSFLLRITRNCPWNQCLFCPVYKGRKFSLRSVEEIKNDIESARVVMRRLMLSVTEESGGIGSSSRLSRHRRRRDLAGRHSAVGG